MVGVGLFLAYAGIKDVPIQAGLRSLASGTLPEGTPPTKLTNTGDFAPGVPTGTGGDFIGSTIGSALVGAARARAAEKYSQLRRFDPGFSDCSSFVWKSFRDIGITPPKAFSTTLTFPRWPALKPVKYLEAGAGDLAIAPGAPGHMVILTSHSTAIGQQNRRVNVKEGRIGELMASHPYFSFYRYSGPG